MLLSIVSFEFSATNGGNGVVIDFADPGITRAFSFILAVAPWGVWDFVGAGGTDNSAEGRRVGVFSLTEMYLIKNI